jgi:hypothetical protein
MDSQFLQSVHYDSESRFASYILASGIVTCAYLFFASILLSVAMFLTPVSSPIWWWLGCIWLSFGVVVCYCWICACIARRQQVTKWFAMEMQLFMWIVSAFVAYLAFYRGLWSIFHSLQGISFNPHWKTALFALGGLLAFGMMVKATNIARGVDKRIRLFEKGSLPSEKPTKR